MRAVVLADDKNIEFLNENFINTWVPNAELGRTHSLRAPIARRREREDKTFDTNTPLAQAIVKGWKTGSKKSSPVDCLIISPECELMGRQPVNEFLDDNQRRKLRHEESYLMFLKESLAGKQPGLGNIVLTPELPAQEVLDVFRVSDATRVVIDASTFSDATRVVIDASTYEDGGILTIELGVGRAEGRALFSLFNTDRHRTTPKNGTENPPVREPLEVLRVSQRNPKGVLNTSWRIPSGDTARITHLFDRGQIFELRVTGYAANEAGSVNAFLAKISVEQNR